MMEKGDCANVGWRIEVEAPFTYQAAKNQIYARAYNGQVYRRTAGREWQTELAWQVKAALGHKKVYTNKVWLDIYVKKPDNRGDAINLLDVVADAVKEAIGLDDRWYSVRSIDWEISKDNPKVRVGISQDELWDARICTTCKRLLPYARYVKEQKECIECKEEKRRLKILTKHKE